MTMSSTRSFRALAVLALAPLAGCYHYVTAPSPPAEPGSAVRVHLTAPRSFDVSGFTAHDVHRVDGSLVEREPEAWVVAADALHARGGNRFNAASWALTIPAEAFDRVEVRTFSGWRTAVASVAAAVAIYFGSEAIKGSSSTPGGDSGDGGGRAVIPVP